MAQLTVLGLSYKTAALCVREKLTFDVPAAQSCSQELLGSGLVAAIAIVSTCHRTEFYCDGLALSDSDDFWAWLQANKGFPSRDRLAGAIYQYRDTEAIAHLLRVSAGLDSLILGETQILGQMKLAYDQARVAGTLGKHLTRLFQFAFGVAKKIRTDTWIGSHSLSVACMAARLVKGVFPQQRPLNVMFVGSGVMITIAARRLQRLGMLKPVFANRSLDKVKALADKFQGEVCALTALGEHLGYIDVLVSATASPLPLIRTDTVAKALGKRADRPLLLIDLAVPRDIEPGAGLLPGVYLYTVDDLQDMAIDNRQALAEAAIAAEQLIGQKAQEFMRWLWAQADIAHIRRYRQACDRIRESSLQEALIQLGTGKRPEAVVRHLAYRLSRRLMHEPTLALRDSIFNKKNINRVRYESIYS